jgi:hypothetical protein
MSSAASAKSASAGASMPAVPSAGTIGKGRRDGIERLPILATEARIGLVVEEERQVDRAEDGTRVVDAAA